MTLRERKKRQTMQSVLAAARELLSEKEYDSITTKEVAARAGIGEATLFRYVINKKNLFLIIYEDFFNEVLEACQKSEAHDKENQGTADYYIERIAKMYRDLAGIYKRDPDSGFLYVRDSFSAEEFGKRGLEQGDRWHDLVEGVVRRGQNAGVLRQTPPRVVAQNCHALYVHEVLASHARHRDPKTIDTRLVTRLMALLEPLRLPANSP